MVSLILTSGQLAVITLFLFRDIYDLSYSSSLDYSMSILGDLFPIIYLLLLFHLIVLFLILALV